MKLRETPLEGVVIVEPQVFRDDRGFFLETYNQGKLAALGFDEEFVQDNHSLSAHGTLRGLHAQLQQPQGKLVRVVEGRIFDVAVDLRLDSPSYRHWFGVELDAVEFLELYVPPGFAHGFSVLSERAQVQYKCTALYDQQDEICLRFDEPTLGADGGGIDWRLGTTEPTLSAKDSSASSLDELEPRLATAAAYRTGA